MFKGIYIALVTPFHEDGSIDHDCLATLCNHLIESGVHGLVPCGTTGESATLSHQEHHDVIKTVVATSNNRVPVIAGTGSNATAEAIELTTAAKEAGADGSLLITPYYNKPTQAGLLTHFEAIAKATQFPLVLYNIPGRTAINLEPETVAELAKLPEIVGIKEATGIITTCTDILRRLERPFSVFAGDDAMTLPILSIGGCGVISVVGQLLPNKMVALWDAWQAKDLQTASTIHH
ncbi:4-hydroxy-tetrahydrodipicolinate synthase-like [Ylistrum balloti]|uniref:4-hydroxy-tetrahydrodipicolinate synthase-like n=1 Tax=Ylistrum balloti TaxID=509963 RepID=UPI00290587D8|nr:4-hydroxy-tetrahydrodipicolinate synthase-like [Ylistrum balloti]